MAKEKKVFILPIGLTEKDCSLVSRSNGPIEQFCLTFNISVNDLNQARYNGGIIEHYAEHMKQLIINKIRRSYE